MTIRINGEIVSNDDKWVYDLFGIEAFCPKDLFDQLDRIPQGQAVDIEINSPGGYVYDGSEIYTALINRRGEVNITITGLAASMASVIAMAGTNVQISPTAQIMIHNASGRGGGDYRAHEHYAMQLKKTNDTISNAYAIKTGMSKEELFDLMDKETWLTPDEALELGFVDGILNGEQTLEYSFAANYSSKLLPMEVINKAKRNKEQEQLEFLKLKGGNING